MSKARDLARAGTALSSVDATELGYLDGVTSAVQTQIDSKLATSTASSTYAPLTSATLTTPTVNNGTLNSPIIKSPEETSNLIGTGFAGYTYNVGDSTFTYIFANSTANGTINFRSNSSTTLNASLNVGDSVTCSLLVTNGATAYYPTGFQVDGSAVTPKWSGGTAPSAGNASSIDAYSFTIIKTADATFTVLAAGPIKYAQEKLCHFLVLLVQVELVRLP